ncbi:ATPase family AAA domain-containing protein 1-A [Pyrenophora tritici-repentis]|nr:ATPase family AAA domain-containing protein 1-A [Pyrenophora tritici-repentis]
MLANPTIDARARSPTNSRPTLRRRIILVTLLTLLSRMHPTPHPRIQLLPRVIQTIQIPQSPAPTKEILRPQPAHITLRDRPTTAQCAVCLLPADVFADRAHGGVAAGFFDVGAAHAGGDADEVVEVEVCGVDFCAAKDEGEYVVALDG